MSQFGTFFGDDAPVGRQLLWEHMLYQVLVLFREAEKRIRSAERQAYYTQLEGWWRKASHKLNGQNGYKVPEETAVSEAIIEEMEAIKRDLVLNAPSLGPDMADIDSLQFHAEAPRKKKTGIGRRAKPTDFRFYRSGLGGLDLRIEAKVITKEADIAKSYLSKDGLGRFSHPTEPYTDDLIGGMVAYTVTEDRVSWEAKIKSEISFLSPAIPTFHHPLPPGGEPALFSQVPFKLVKNPAQSEVLVFHLVLEFDCAPSAR